MGDYDQIQTPPLNKQKKIINILFFNFIFSIVIPQHLATTLCFKTITIFKPIRTNLQDRLQISIQNKLTINQLVFILNQEMQQDTIEEKVDTSSPDLTNSEINQQQKHKIEEATNQAETKLLYLSQFSTKGLPSIIVKKLQGLVEALNKPVINIKTLKLYLVEGIPDQAAVIREYCWKIILGYLPEEKKLWNDRITRQQKTYFQFVKLFLPKQRFQDYPMILKKDNQHYKDLSEDFNLWQQIQKDTSRTHAELSFFCTPAPNIMIPFLTSPRRQKFRLINGDDDQKYKEFLSDKQKQRKTYRYDYLSRILFIYAKLNPKILYVQGMNEILAPIFYLANSGRQPSCAVEEAACFFMFNNAISDVIQLHIKDLDKAQNGIYGKLNQVNQMLMVIQPRIWSRLQLLKIDPFFYCFRWMTLLFAQDFQLFDTLRIWESIFSSENRLLFMSYLAVSIIIAAKQVILQNDFTSVLNYLQNMSQHMHINSVINIALELQHEFRDENFSEIAKKTKSHIQKKNKQKQNSKNSIGNAITGKVNKFIGRLNKLLD